MVEEVPLAPPMLIPSAPQWSTMVFVIEPEPTNTMPELFIAVTRTSATVAFCNDRPVVPLFTMVWLTFTDGVGPEVETPIFASAMTAPVIVTAAAVEPTTIPYQMFAAVPVWASNVTGFAQVPLTASVPATVSSTCVGESPPLFASGDANRTTGTASMASVAPF